MKKATLLLSFIIAVYFISGCAPQEEAATVKPAKQAEAVIEEVAAIEGDKLVYLEVAGAAASSFDETPDWAPEPNPMAPVDGDMLTRWSSSYVEGPQWIYFDLGKPGVVSNIILFVR